MTPLRVTVRIAPVPETLTVAVAVPVEFSEMFTGLRLLEAKFTSLYVTVYVTAPAVTGTDDGAPRVIVGAVLSTVVTSPWHKSTRSRRSRPGR